MLPTDPSTPPSASPMLDPIPLTASPIALSASWPPMSSSPPRTAFPRSDAGSFSWSPSSVRPACAPPARSIPSWLAICSYRELVIPSHPSKTLTPFVTALIIGLCACAFCGRNTDPKDTAIMATPTKPDSNLFVYVCFMMIGGYAQRCRFALRAALEFVVVHPL